MRRCGSGSGPMSFSSAETAKLLEQIEKAFAHRKIPAEVVVPQHYLQIDSDVEDALWFKGRDWRDITSADWERHNCAVIFLSADAFVYYLPSLLILPLRDANDCPHLAIDSFVWQLDCSPGIENINPGSWDRFSRLNDAEFCALRDWLLWACEHLPDIFWGAAQSGPGDGYGRVFDTLNLIQREKGTSGRSD